MNNDFRNDYSDYLMHYGIKGMKLDHHIYKKKEEGQPVRPGRQTGYQHASNAVQAIQNVSRDGFGNTVLQDAAARIPHFQPVGGPVNISNSKKNPKAKSAVNQRDQENNKRELINGIQQVTASAHQHHNIVSDTLNDMKRRKKSRR